MDQALLDRFKAITGPNGFWDRPADIAPYTEEPRGKYFGNSPLVLRPGTTEEVAAIVRLAHETQTPLVPQGGNTGLVGGQVPSGEIVLSLTRMNKIRACGPVNNTLTVDAGVTLAAVQDAAASVDRLFPLSLASEGTASIGGNIATNAGGTQVLHYGNTRDLVLGLEAVLPNGEIWNGLSGLRKDNTGYDLKQLLIGSEGTLGVITAATLKLFPRPAHKATAFVAIPDPAAAVALLNDMQGASGHQVTAFEIIPRIALDFLLTHDATVRDPLGDTHDWYVLIELSGGMPMDEVMIAGLSSGLATDAALAQSDSDAKAFWHIRESISEIQKREGGSIKHDVSVPISAIPEFLARATEAVQAACPGIRPVPFGHIGDGNIHFNLTQPVGADTAAYLDRWDEIQTIVHDIVHDLGGSISAEHGLGQMKADEIARYKSPAEIAAMRAIKAALDPKGLFNPGKLLPNSD